MSTQQPFAKHTPATPNFTEISLKLASPETILEWSHGEVTKPETINYRTQRAEKSGLFDERIFGPEQDYECSCKKYRGGRYRGIICEKCDKIYKNKIFFFFFFFFRVFSFFYLFFVRLFSR